DEKDAERVREIVKRAPAAVVSFGSPYVIRQFPGAGTFICAYSKDEASQRAAARALAGKIPFKGTLPVRLDADEGAS
ncbi:MAG: hypothetical protein ACYTAF_09590, partial [Planctomycetota bacterium]